MMHTVAALIVFIDSFNHCQYAQLDNGFFFFVLLWLSLNLRFTALFSTSFWYLIDQNAYNSFTYTCTANMYLHQCKFVNTKIHILLHTIDTDLHRLRVINVNELWLYVGFKVKGIVLLLGDQ